MDGGRISIPRSIVGSTVLVAVIAFITRPAGEETGRSEAALLAFGLCVGASGPGLVPD